MAEKIDSDKDFYAFLSNNGSFILEKIVKKYFLPSCTFLRNAVKAETRFTPNQLDNLTLLLQNSVLFYYILSIPNTKTSPVSGKSQNRLPLIGLDYKLRYLICYFIEIFICFFHVNAADSKTSDAISSSNRQQIFTSLASLNLKHSKILGSKSKRIDECLFAIFDSIINTDLSHLEIHDDNNKPASNKNSGDSSEEDEEDLKSKRRQENLNSLKQHIKSYFNFVIPVLWKAYQVGSHKVWEISACVASKKSQPKSAAEQEAGKLKIISFFVKMKKLFGDDFEPLKCDLSIDILNEFYSDDKNKKVAPVSSRSTRSRNGQASSANSQINSSLNNLEKNIYVMLSTFVSDNGFAATRLGKIPRLVQNMLKSLLKLEDKSYDEKIVILSLTSSILDSSPNNRLILEEMPEYDQIIDQMIKFFLSNEKLVKLHEGNLGKDTKSQNQQSNKQDPDLNPLNQTGFQNNLDHIELNAEENKMEEEDKSQMKRVLNTAEIHMRANVLAANSGLFLGCCCRHTKFNLTLSKMQAAKLDFSSIGASFE